MASQKLNKAGALDLLNARYQSLLVDGSVGHFATLNSTKDVWWFDIPRTRFLDDSLVYLDLVLHDTRTDELHHLRVPMDEARAAFKAGRLAVREDKDTVSLELSARQDDFLRDRRSGGDGVRFKPFLVRT